MADSKRFQTNPDDKTQWQTAIGDEAFRPEPVTVTAGATGAVFDLGPVPYGFAVILNGGTATYRQCAADGTIVTGAPAAVAIVSGALVQRPWRWVKIVATAVDCVVCPV